MSEDVLRDLQAQIEAQHFIIEILLAAFINSAPPKERDDLVERIIRSSEITSHLTGITTSDFEAEKIADLAVRMPSHLRMLVQRAHIRAKHKGRGAATL